MCIIFLGFCIWDGMGLFGVYDLLSTQPTHRFENILYNPHLSLGECVISWRNGRVVTGINAMLLYQDYHQVYLVNVINYMVISRLK